MPNDLNQTNMQSSDDINAHDLLHKDILDLMGYQNLTDEEKNHHYTVMLETVNNRVAIRIADSLGENDAQAWQDLAQKDEQSAIQFLIEREIDLQKWLLEETVLYKAEMVKAARAIAKGTRPEDLANQLN